MNSPSCKRKINDYEEKPSPLSLNQKDAVHCQGCVCWSLMENGEMTNQNRFPSTHHGLGHQSDDGRKQCMRNLFGLKNKNKIMTPQEQCDSEQIGKIDMTPSKFIRGTMEPLDYDGGSARWHRSCSMKEGLSDNGFSSDDDIDVQVYSQDEDEDEDEKPAIAKEDAFFRSRYWNQELKKTKADQSPRQKEIDPMKGTGLLSPLGKLLTGKSLPDCDLDNKNLCKIQQKNMTYNHDQLLKQNFNSGPSQNIGKNNEDICLAFPKDGTAQRKKFSLYQCKDVEKIHKSVSDQTEQIIKHQCKDASFFCSFKTITQNRFNPNKVYEIEKTPAEILEEGEVHPKSYLSKDEIHSTVKKPIKVKLDIQATVETLHTQQFSTRPQSSPTQSAKSPSKEKRPNKDRDKYSIFAKVCTNEPHNKHRRLSIDSAMPDNTVSFYGYHKNSTNSYNKFRLFAQHRHDQSCQEGGPYTQSKQNESSGFSGSTNTLMQNALITSPRYRCQQFTYDPHVLQNEHFWPGFVDTHCHLDFLFRRCNHDSGSHARFRAQCQGQDAYPVAFEGCVAVFCQPWTFGKTTWWEEFLGEANVWAAFGCHPHYARFFGEEEEDHLRLALLNPKVVALGEIGLDYSNRNNQHHEQQKMVFRRQLNIALEYNKPLVIHCRDAERDCLAILKELVPRDYLIHRHCFTEGWEEAREWLSAFSNLYLGITGLATFPNSERAWKIQDVLKQIPLSRLLLETDAPYFRPYCYQESGRWSHPGMAIHVAAQVASVRGESIQKVLKYARNNTKMVYGI
nr:uncharacterized protein LOC113816668 [Penaeus vannamei]